MTSRTAQILQRMGVPVALCPANSTISGDDDDDFKTIAIILFMSWLVLKFHFALIFKNMLAGIENRG